MVTPFLSTASLATAAMATLQQTANRSAVPWPWPLVPLLLAVTIGLAALVLALVYHYVVEAKE